MTCIALTAVQFIPPDHQINQITREDQLGGANCGRLCEFNKRAGGVTDGCGADCRLLCYPSPAVSLANSKLNLTCHDVHPVNYKEKTAIGAIALIPKRQHTRLIVREEKYVNSDPLGDIPAYSDADA
ncbi:hypothetical protein MSG28_009352 [Choristoneura fumiferana]|uniref:Uncharacterized protein n=1 Tax=Choristoneura fumiferana TaxID=7141 RepID=A0ACC0KX93_CHOFU|nr:hypothetical protein MSG28_009352 [Choristoneura fumiferana]